MSGLALAALLSGLSHPVELRVTVYDRSELDPQTTANVFAEVTRILRTAGIHPLWSAGDLESREAVLLQYPEPPRRGAEVAAACRARNDIALDLLQKVPAGIGPSVLGTAVPFASEGLNVRVFIDRVEAVAVQENLPPGVIAAHAAVHEIGHVLLRSNEHAASGLMAGRWAAHEYRRMAAGLLIFSGAEGSRMRAAINRGECPSESTATMRSGKHRPANVQITGNAP